MPTQPCPANQDEGKSISTSTNTQVQGGIRCWQCRQGEQIAIYDGRPNTEMFLATGTLEENNLSDHLTVQASLVAADKLYMLKKQVARLDQHTPGPISDGW